MRYTLYTLYCKNLRIRSRLFLIAFRRGSLNVTCTNLCNAACTLRRAASANTPSIRASKACKPLTVAIISTRANFSSEV